MAHSRRCHPTKENITESQQGEKMFVCLIHRANLGKDWGNPTGGTECRYPEHKGKQTRAGEN